MELSERCPSRERMADGSWRPRQISCRLCREPRTDRDADDDRAQRLMSGADQESRVRVDLTAVVIAVREGVPYILTVERSAPPKLSLPSGPLASSAERHGGKGCVSTV